MSKAIQVESWISYTLRVGVLVCGVITAIGWIMSLTSGDWEKMTPVFQGQYLETTLVPQTWIEMALDAFRGEPTAVMRLGIRLLIALPVIRVALTALIFLLERDYIFVCLAGIVLALVSAGYVFN
jgi:uncharacterized membrane protein